MKNISLLIIGLFLFLLFSFCQGEKEQFLPTIHDPIEYELDISKVKYFEPYSHNIFISGDSIFVQKIRIKNKNKFPIVIQKMEFFPSSPKPSYFSHSLHKKQKIKANETFEFSVTFKVNELKKTSDYSTGFKVRYEYENHKNIKSYIKFNVFKTANILIENNGEIDFGMIDGTKLLSKKIKIKNMGSTNLIIDTSSLFSCIDVEKLNLKGGETMSVICNYNPIYDRTDFEYAYSIPFKNYYQTNNIIIKGKIKRKDKIEPLIQFEIDSFNFDTIKQSEARFNKDFVFTNTSDYPIIIYRASTGDGGTFASFPKKPIFPGEKGTITFHASMKSRRGKFSKNIHVKYRTGTTCSNAYLHYVIKTKGYILPETKSE